MYISQTLRQQISADARDRCGYCLAQQEVIGVQLHVEHIIPERAGGLSTRENLWLACGECNNRGAMMTIEQAVLENLRGLPTEKKQEVLNFVEFLRSKTTPKQPRRNPIGLFAHLRIHISASDIKDSL
jgi:5-methylcytosine-specific restriction endonuclease McrA